MKDLIKKYKLSYTKLDSIEKRDARRYHYRIKVNNVPFNYYGSAQDFENKNHSLNATQLLLAFRYIILDALSFTEDDKESFLNGFGYLNPDYNHLLNNGSLTIELLSTEELKLFRAGIEAYKGCEDAYNSLGLSDNELSNILDELSNRGIE